MTMPVSTYELLLQMTRVREVLAGLTPGQADQARPVLVRASNLELSAIAHRRESAALGAALRVTS